MIRFIAVNGTGMFSFGNMPTIMLDNRGLVFLCGINRDRGGSNGSAKSSFINTIKEICYGKNDTGKSGPNVVNKRKNWKNGCFGAIWFYDHQGVFWRVFMLRKWKGKPPDVMNMVAADTGLGGPSEVIANGGKYTGTDIFLERWNGEVWVDKRPTSIGNKTLKDAQSKIGEVLGMTYDQFSAYVMLGQRAESALVYGSSGEREKIIQAVADVTIWDRAAIYSKDRISEGTSHLTSKQTEYNSAKNVVDTMIVPTDEDFQQVQAELDRLNSELAQHQQEIQIKNGEKNTLIQSMKDIDIQPELDILAAERKHANDRLVEWKEPDYPQGYNNADMECIELMSEKKRLELKLGKFKSMGEGECAACGQTITDKHVKKHIKESQALLDMTIQDLDKTKQLKEELSTKHEKDTAAAKKKMVSDHEHEMHCIDKKEGEVRAQQDHNNTISMKVGIITNDIANINTIVVNTTNNIGNARQRIEQMKQVKASKDQWVAKLTATQTEINLISSTLEHWKWVERHLKKLKLQEYNVVIDKLNQLISHQLRSFWGPDITATFVTAQEKSRGKGVKQGMDIIVEEEGKEGVPIEMYSGGELKSIILSLYRAMRTLVNERGAGINIAAIDELDKDLDDPNVDRLVDAFEHMLEDASTCIIISHKEKLLSTMRFNDVWTAEKKDGISTIITGAQRAAA
jgi:DNA repair exonuclease SbcCD ATPase subunit